MDGVGYGGGQAVDDGHGVEALKQDAPPLGGDGTAAKQIVHADTLGLGQPAQPCGGEVVAPGRGDEVRRVGDRGGELPGLQPPNALVDRAPRPPGDGDHLQAVEEGHRRQTAQQLFFASGEPHSSLSSSAASCPASPAALSRLLSCFHRSRSSEAPPFSFGGEPSPFLSSSTPF